MYMYVVARVYIASVIYVKFIPLFCTNFCILYMLLNRGFIPIPPYIDYQGKLKRFTNILNHLVSTDMDFTQLDAYLTSQMRKRQVCQNQQSVIIARLKYTHVHTGTLR